MKKTIEQSIETGTPWHVDFRDVSTLPDMKIVRTAFFTNAIPVFILGMALIMLALLEYKRFSLESQIRGFKEKLEENEAAHRGLLALQGRFSRQERSLVEAVSFREDSFDLSRLLHALGTILPEEVRIIGMRLQEPAGRGSDLGRELQINGSIAGAPEEATTVFSGFLNLLAEDKTISTGVREFVPGSLVPTPERDLMAFSMRIVYETQTREGGKKP